MKGPMPNTMAMMAMTVVVLAVQAEAQNSLQPAQESQTAAKVQHAPVVTDQPIAAKRLIVVSLEDRKLALIEDGKPVKVYTVAVGKASTPSPAGTFTIARRVVNPTYSHDGRTVPPGPNNPVGTRWMGLSIPGYGIHGTNEPRSIGKAASMAVFGWQGRIWKNCIRWWPSATPWNWSRIAMKRRRNCLAARRLRAIPRRWLWPVRPRPRPRCRKLLPLLPRAGCRLRPALAWTR